MYEKGEFLFGISWSTVAGIDIELKSKEAFMVNKIYYGWVDIHIVSRVYYS